MMGAPITLRSVCRWLYMFPRGALAVFPCFASAVAAQQVEFSGQIAIDGRWFPEDPAFAGQFDGTQASILIEPELAWKSEGETDQLKFTPFLRLDAEDDERTHFDVREAYWRHIGGDWEFLIGANRVFWGVTESRHLVNIINQIDAVEDIDEEDFLGQPMLQAGRQTDIGRFDLFLMTGFRERTFPGRKGRLRTSPPVDQDAAVFESSAEEWRPEVALRYSHFIGEVDIGLHVFHGTGREPDLVPAPDGQSLIPRYPVITQAGADLQWTRDAWLWKFEGLVREGQGNTFAAAVAGVEYTIFQMAGTDADLGLLVEVLYDGRDARAFPTPFDKDVFAGARLALNDVQDTQALAGAVFDVETDGISVRLEFERRIGDTFRIALEGQGFFNIDDGDPLTAFRRDSFISLRLSRFF